MFKDDRIILVKIGSKCQEIRENYGYTRRQLGIALKVPESMIENFEYGKINNAVLYEKYLNLPNV